MILLCLRQKSSIRHKISLTRVIGFWFGLLLYVPVNSYDVRMVSSPNHTFFLGTLEQAVNPILRAQTFHCSWQQLFLKESVEGRRMSSRHYFLICLHESMGMGWDQTGDPWICSQTRICSQTSYWLRYAALSRVKGATIYCCLWIYFEKSKVGQMLPLQYASPYLTTLHLCSYFNKGTALFLE